MQQWYVHDRGATTGPFTTEQVQEAIKNNKIGPDATYCVTGTTTFRPIVDLPELAPKTPTELPIAAPAGKTCAVRKICPVARVMKKVLILALMASVAWILYAKFGCMACHKHVIKPL